MGKRRILIFLLIILFHLFLLKSINFFPYPELFVYSYLTSKGFLPYAQIFDQHFPGLVFSPINLYSLGMMTPQRIALFHFAFICISHLFLFKISQKMFKGWLIFLPNLLYLIWQPYFEGYVFWIDSFITPFLLASFYYLFSDKKINLFVSGILLGFAFTCKQVVLPLIFLLILYLFLIRRKGIFIFLLGLSLPLLIMLLYILKIGVWKEFYYWTITYNLTTFAYLGRKLPTLSLLLRAGLVFFIGSIAWFTVIYKNAKKGATLLGIFGFASLFFTFARFDYIHLQPSLPFFLLMIVLLFSRLSMRLKILFGAFYLLTSLLLISRFYIIMRGSKVYFFGNLEKEVAMEVRKLTKPAEKVFALGTLPHLYYLSERLPPGGIFAFQFPWVMVVAEERILLGLISDPPALVVRDTKAQVDDNLNIISFIPEIHKYVEENYLLYKRIGESTEILIKREKL